MLLSQKYPLQLQSLMPLYQTNEPLSDAIPRFNSTGEGKQKTKLKFRQNGIPKSQDNQNLLIHRLQSLPKIIIFFQFLSINLAIFHKVCAYRKKRRISVQAMPINLHKKHLYCVSSFHNHTLRKGEEECFTVR